MKIEEYRKIREHLEAARDIIDESRNPTELYSEEKLYMVQRDELRKIDNAILLYIVNALALINDNLEDIYFEEFGHGNISNEEC